MLLPCKLQQNGASRLVLPLRTRLPPMTSLTQMLSKYHPVRSSPRSKPMLMKESTLRPPLPPAFYRWNCPTNGVKCSGSND